jgi:hypothetical protein
MSKLRLDTTMQYMAEAMMRNKISQLVKRLTPKVHFDSTELEGG